MMVSDVLTYLKTLHVRLALTPQGQLHCKAPRGVLTLVLQGTLKTCKAQVTQLLTTGEDVELPSGVTLPEADYTRFLTWRTGKVPATGQMMTAPLKEPTHHDTPSSVRTYLGVACTAKACAKSVTTTVRGHPASHRYAPTGICVSCWERWDKKGGYTPEKQAKRDASLAKKREANMDRIQDTQQFPDFA